MPSSQQHTPHYHNQSSDQIHVVPEVEEFINDREGRVKQGEDSLQCIEDEVPREPVGELSVDKLITTDAFSSCSRHIDVIV